MYCVLCLVSLHVGRPSFRLQNNLVTRKPLFLDDKLSTVSDMPSFLFNLPYFAGPKQPRLTSGGNSAGAPTGGLLANFLGAGGSDADAGLSGSGEDSVLQFRINKPAKIFVLWCEENELEKWCVCGAYCVVFVSCPSTRVRNGQQQPESKRHTPAHSTVLQKG